MPSPLVPSPSDEWFQELVNEMLKLIPADTPDWTDHNDSDPGVTLLQLFAFVTESLLYRQKQIAPSGAAAAQRLAQAARALAVSSSSRSGCGLRRVNYFAGQLLNAKDLADEQDYFRKRLRRRNRLLAGSGIVSGLGVSVAPGNGGEGQSAVVEPGFALDPLGEEIEVCQQTEVSLPARGNPLYLQLQFRDRPTDPVPVDSGPCTSDEELQQPSRIEETFGVVLTPAVQADAVPIARLIRNRGRWRPDPRFRPPRPRK